MDSRPSVAVRLANQIAFSCSMSFKSFKHGDVRWLVHDPLDPGVYV